MRYLVILLCLVISSCGLSQSSKKQNAAKEGFQNMAKEYFGDSYIEKPNVDGRYVLVYRKYKDPRELMASVRFFIYDNEIQSKIFEDELNNGEVKWVADNEVMAIARHQKTSTSDDTPSRTIYYFNVEHNTKRAE